MKSFDLRLALVIAVVVAAGAFAFTRPSGSGGDERSITAFERDLAAGRIDAIRVDGSVLFVEPLGGDPYKTRLPAPPSDVSRFVSQGVDVTVRPPRARWVTVVTYAVPLIAIAAFVSWLARAQRARGGDPATAFGRNRAKAVAEESVDLSFADVAGVEEAKADLAEVVAFLKDPTAFHDVGARIPRGILMSGPPGAGKTHLARAVAGEANVPFYATSGSDFVEMFVGVGAARVRDLFATAKKHAPCIVFIDEIDAVGRRRGSSGFVGNDEREQTLNALLVEMDGFDTEHDVVVVAATNRPDVLDPALLRPGRFDRQVVVDAPDVRGRTEILRVHAKGKSLAPDVDLDRVARRTPGFVGADLENLLNEGALLAARDGRTAVTTHDLDAAADRVTMGPERRSRRIGDAERRVTAYHEAGHALAAHLLDHADPVHKVTIVPRGRALGFVMQLPDEDRLAIGRLALLDRIAVALAGRVVEQAVFGDVTTGARNDLRQATDLARRMVTQWGMSETVGPISLDLGDDGSFLGEDPWGRRVYGEHTARAVDLEVRSIVETQRQRVADLLGARRAELDAIANALLDRETLDGDAFAALAGARPRDAS